MKSRARMMRALGLIGACVLAVGSLRSADDEHGRLAKQILEATGVRGGLVVHLDCGGGELTVALRATESYVVHGLDADARDVERARQHIRARGLYGAVSASRFGGGRLPYAANIVNLLVAEDLGEVPMEEALRVLVPNGVAYVRRAGAWTKTVKPRPAEIDDWSHFLHDASNNAVAQDLRVGPPRRLQWTAGPPWCRSHEFISSFCAMVSAGGRVFYVLDEGQPGVTDERLPERWTLIARDAFNGAPLWRRPLPDWRGGEWRSRAMRGRPPSVPRRIVADAERLYATLSHRAPLSVLDAATGETLRTIEGTEGTQEILLSERTIVVRLAPLDQGGKRTGGSIVAVDADSGQLRWQVPAGKFMAQSLAAANGRVIYNDTSETVCLDLANGQELWRAASPRAAGRGGQDKTFIMYGDLVLEGGGSGILARSAETGEPRWTAPGGGGSMRPHDFFVARGRAWHAASGGIAGYDLATGEPTRVIDPSSVQSRGHHLRCYRAKATERYLITQFRGAEFISLTDDSHCQNDWLRGPCRYGLMPCNGMLYAPPHQCFCYGGAMMTGLNALTTAPDEELHAVGSSPAPDRLQRGPAYRGISASGRNAGDADDWPMYRHDARRTGATGCEVPEGLDERWQAELGGRLTPPVAVGGRVYVAAKDAHTVYALGADDGSVLWDYVADARIDSPPTVYQGRVLFGCADGCVYCLRASDGALAWRYRAAPAERLIMADGQLESAWPVHGAVLILDGVVYCVAGRSSYLDGGLFLYGLDPRTGQVVHEGRLHTLSATREDATEQPFLPAFHIEGARSDILVAEGGYIYVNQIKFTPDLKQQDTPYVPHDPEDTTGGLDLTGKEYVAGDPYLNKSYETLAALGVKRGHLGDRQVGLHLFSTGGFLEDSWFNRTYWMYSKTWPGYYIANVAPRAGQLLVIGAERTYAVQAYPTRNVHSPMFTPGDKGYLLIADGLENEPMLDYRSWGRDKGMGFTRGQPPEWHRWVPVRMRSMVLAGEHLFVAGPPDVVDPEDPMAAFEGRKGGQVWRVSSDDGRKLGEYMLDSPPVLDGMIAANGRLFLSTRDGKVLCLGAN